MPPKQQIPAPEFDTLNDDQKNKCREFIEKVFTPMDEANELAPMYKNQGDADREITAYKFMIARKFVLADAEKMFRGTNQYRVEKGFDEGCPIPFAFACRGFDFDAIKAHFGWTEDRKPQECDKVWQVINPSYQATYHKWDKWGHPVMIENTGKINVKLLVERSKLCTPPKHKFIEPVGNTFHPHFNEAGGWLCRYMDQTHSEKVGRRIQGVTVILNLDGFGYGHLLGEALDIAKEAWRIDAEYYPEGLHKLFAVNCPGMIMFAFNIVKGWLDPRVVTKIQFLKPKASAEALLEYIDEANLPAFLGGKCECEGGCMPTPDNAELPADAADQLSQKVLVDAGKRNFKEIECEAGETIAWDFCVADDRNIEFKAEFVSDDNSNDREIFSMLKVPNQTDRFEVPCKGKLLLTFSNEYSWVRGKTIVLRFFKA